MVENNNSSRLMVGVPKDTELYEFLLKNNKKTHWKLLDDVIRQLPKSKEERAVSIFNSFVEQLSELYPETNGNLEKLRPLIFKHIIKRESLDAWYFEELRQL